MDYRQSQFEHLIQSLKLLAAPPEELPRLFPSFVHVPDELALELWHWITFGDELVEHGFLSVEICSRIKSIDDKLEEMTSRDDGSLWTMDAVAHNADWCTIRTEVRAILTDMDIPLKIDSISGITYVEGGEE